MLKKPFINNNLFLVVLMSFICGSCVAGRTQQDYEFAKKNFVTNIQSHVGKTEEELVSLLGIPQKILDLNEKTKFLLYKWSGPLVNESTRWASAFTGLGGGKYEYPIVSCEIMFTSTQKLDENIVTAASYKGDGCF